MSQGNQGPGRQHRLVPNTAVSSFDGRARRQDIPGAEAWWVDTTVRRQIEELDNTRAELTERLFAATVDSLDRLPPEEAEAVMLYFYSDLSLREIAKKQGASAHSTVHYRIQRALASLKDILQTYQDQIRHIEQSIQVLKGE